MTKKGSTQVDLELEGVQPKIPPFSTRHIVSGNYKVVSQLSQPVFLSFSFLNSARPHLVIGLCRALKYFDFCLRLFSKLTCGFADIKLLTFFKNAKLHFSFLRELSVFGL